ncbi:hypothetical protein FACS1894105_01750 [Clostridia bacterium]|nr:hypothetical protein FACS1894105_01750 [Clostridia bacterium]
MLSLFKSKHEKAAQSVTVPPAAEAKPQTDSVPAVRNLVIDIPVEAIVPNPNQPRREFDERALYGLAQSIRDYGIIQPLSVRKLPGGNTLSGNIASDNFQSGIAPNGNAIGSNFQSGNMPSGNATSSNFQSGNMPSGNVIGSNFQNGNMPSGNMYELIAGERRLRAARLAGFAAVPCVVTDTDTKASAELAIIENLQREDLNFFEQAEAIRALIEKFGYTQEQTARRLSISQSYIANKLRILKLSYEERQLVTEYALTERHARAFIRITDENARKDAIDTVIKRSMNVAAAEKYIDKLVSPGERVSSAIPQEKRGKSVLIVKDIRLFLNTIDRAVSAISDSGIGIKSERVDRGDFYEIMMTIPKNKSK